MTRFSEKCLAESECIARLVAEVAAATRGEGVPVSVSEEVMAARLLAAYAAAGRGLLGIDDFVAVFVSCFAKRGGDEAAVERAVRRLFGGRSAERIIKAMRSDLRLVGSSFGRPVRKSFSKMSAEERAALGRLQAVGVVRRGRRGFYSVSERVAHGIAEELARRYGGYEEAVAARVREAVNAGRRSLIELLGDEVLRYIDLSSLSLDKLGGLYRASRARAVREAAARAAAEKLDRGEPLGRSASDVFEMLARHGLLTPRRVERLLAAEPRLAERAAAELGTEQVLDIAERIASRNPTLGAEIAARSMRAGGRVREALAEAFREGLGTLSLREGVEGLASLWRARRSLEEYLVTWNQGYLDMALFELERSRGGGEARAALLSAARLLGEGDAAAALRILIRGLDDASAFELLSSIYHGSAPEDVKRLALSLMRIVMRRAVRRFEASARMLYRFERSTVEGERLDLRATLFRTVRSLPDPLVWLRRRRARTLVVALDRSASMRSFSFYAAAAAAAFAPLIERLVVFDSEVDVFEVSGSAGRMAAARLVDLIVSVRFGGFTDIAGAVAEAVRGLSPRKLVLVSDLRQTVAGGDAVEALCDAVRRRWSVDVIAPPSAEPGATSLLRGCGVNVYVVEGRRELSRVLLRVMAR